MLWEIKEVTVCVDGIKLLSNIKWYPNVNYDLMIKVQDQVLKHSNVATSPITNNMVLVKDEGTGNILCISIFDTFILLTWLFFIFLVGKKTKIC